MSDAPQYPPPGGQYPPPGGQPQYPPPGAYPQYPQSPGGYPQYPPSGGGFPGFNSSPGGPLANYGQRVAASLIDGVILGVIGVICDLAAGSIGGRIISLVVGLAYSLIMIGRFGTTVGNMAAGTKVVSLDGSPPGYGKAAIRYIIEGLLFVLLIVPGILDVLWPLWDNQNQTLHDKAAGTLVVQTR